MEGPNISTICIPLGQSGQCAAYVVGINGVTSIHPASYNGAPGEILNFYEVFKSGEVFARISQSLPSIVEYNVRP